MKRLAGAVLLLVLIGIVVGRAACRRDRTQSASEPAPKGAQEPSESSVESAASASPRSEVGGESTVSNPVVAKIETYRGRIVVHQRGKRDLEPEYGLIRWFVTGADESENSPESHIENGNWSLEARPQDVAEIELLSAMGKKATPREKKFVAGSLAGRVIEADWATGPLLHVVDSETHAELAGVRLVSCPQSMQIAYECPSEDARANVLLGWERSPFPLPDTGADEMAWVGAAEHAWRLITFVGSEGERTIELERGASLVCRYTGIPRKTTGVTLRLERESGGRGISLGSYAVRQEGALLLDGLPAGRVLASLEILDRNGVRQQLVYREVELREGAQATVDLKCGAEAISSDDGRVRIEVEGTPAQRMGFERAYLIPVVAREGVPGGPILLTVEDASKLSSEGLTVFQGQSVRPGDYKLIVVPAAMGREVRVERGRLTTIRIRAPQLISLRVRILDAENKTPIGDGSCRAYANGWENELLGVVGQRDGAEGLLGWECAEGQVLLFAWAPGYKSERRELSVVPGMDVVEFALRGREGKYGLMVRLRGKGAPIPAPTEFWSAVQLLPVKGTGMKFEMWWKHAGNRLGNWSADVGFKVDEVGTYRLKFPEGFGVWVDGDREIEVKAGGETELVVEAREVK